MKLLIAALLLQTTSGVSLVHTLHQGPIFPSIVHWQTYVAPPVDYSMLQDLFKEPTPTPQPIIIEVPVYQPAPQFQVSPQLPPVYIQQAAPEVVVYQFTPPPLVIEPPVIKTPRQAMLEWLDRLEARQRAREP